VYRIQNIEYMWSFIQTCIFSVIIIYIIHFLFHYLKDTLTPKKNKDIIGFQNQKYKEILDELRETQEPKIDFSSMENDLLEFANTESSNIES